jgi:CubicO group peptidase (beta-lactamase class C family)
MQSTLRSYVLLWLVVSIGAACDLLTGPDDGYQIPLATDDGWETASLEEVGMEPDSLLALLDLIADTEDHLIHSILIVKNQRLVFEEYWPGVDLDSRTLAPVHRSHDRETLHYVASVSKSITSALVGIAIERGFIRGVGDPLFSYFPEHSDLVRNDNGQIALEHLLSFCSGFDWNEHAYGFDDPRDSHFQMFNATDPMEHLLGRPMVFDVGGEFHYNSGDTNILGEIVRRTSSSSTLVEFADRYLFQPLDIEAYEWIRFPLADEVTFASGGVSLRPRDMAKLGALYLNGGVWNGEHIVPEEWVNVSTQLHTPLLKQYRTLCGYGYNWWLGRSRFREGEVEHVRASGWGGQVVFVFPELELTVVFTAGAYYDTMPLSMIGLIEGYILRAIRD